MHVDKVVQKRTSWPYESAAILWAVAWCMCTSTFMLLLLEVLDELTAAIYFVGTRHFDGIDEFLNFNAATIASVFATENTKDAQLQHVPNLVELFQAPRTQNVPSLALEDRRLEGLGADPAEENSGVYLDGNLAAAPPFRRRRSASKLLRHLAFFLFRHGMGHGIVALAGALGID